MVLTDKDVEKIAYLARIAISDEQRSSLAKDMSNILDLAEQMQQVDTDNVAPMAHPLDITQRLRADEVTEHNQRETFQSIAPATENGLYLVPKVIE